MHRWTIGDHEILQVKSLVSGFSSNTLLTNILKFNWFAPLWRCLEDNRELKMSERDLTVSFINEQFWGKLSAIITVKAYGNIVMSYLRGFKKCLLEPAMYSPGQCAVSKSSMLNFSNQRETIASGSLNEYNQNEHNDP